MPATTSSKRSGAIEGARGRELLGSARRRRSSPPTTRPAARPRRRARRRPGGRPPARRAGSCPRCRRRRLRAGAASRGRRGPSSSLPARRRPTRAERRREALPPAAVTRVRPKEELQDVPPAPAPTTRRAARRNAPRTARCSACSRRRARAGARVEPVPAQERLVLGARPLAVEEVGLRPSGDAHALGLDPVVAAQVVLHHAVLHDVEVAVRRDDALPDRVVPAGDVRHHREPQATRRREERHRARGLHVREHEAGALAPHRLEEPARDMPSRAEEPPLHRAVDRRPVRERAVAVGVEHPVRVPRPASAQHGSRAGGSAGSRAGGSRADGRATRRRARGHDRGARPPP